MLPVPAGAGGRRRGALGCLRVRAGAEAVRLLGGLLASKAPASMDGRPGGGGLSGPDVGRAVRALVARGA